MRLQNTVAIITGGGTGIGKGIALLFAKEGATVVICGRRKEPLAETVQEITKQGGTSAYFTADITSANQIQDIVAKTIQAYGKLDVLVNNAGIYLPTTVDSATEQDWDTVFSVDVKGVFLFSKAVLAHMLAQKSGKIINIASIAGLVAFEGGAAYCAAKGAIVNLTRQMALEYAPQGIQVNGIAPGVITSEMTKTFLENPQVVEGFIAKTPARKIGSPKDIGYAALYLASHESDFVIGQTIIVDGGWTIT